MQHWNISISLSVNHLVTFPCCVCFMWTSHYYIISVGKGGSLSTFSTLCTVSNSTRHFHQANRYVAESIAMIARRFGNVGLSPILAWFPCYFKLVPENCAGYMLRPAEKPPIHLSPCLHDKYHTLTCMYASPCFISLPCCTWIILHVCTYIH